MRATIKEATLHDVKTVADLAIQMWKTHTTEELTQQFFVYMNKECGIIFLAILDRRAVGFAQCGLRHDYVEGTDSCPVGYLEGIFVIEEYRKRGLAKGLIEACERWAKEQGCTEFASDCELINSDSLVFHLKMGFEEANRIICFTKKLEEKMERDFLKKEIERLGKRDKEIMILRYGLLGNDEMTQKEVAELLGISQSYISRIEKKVIKKLKNTIKI